MQPAVPIAAPVQAAPMKFWRKGFVYLILGFLIIGHAIDIGLMEEHWPFSYYPMYARVERRRDRQVLLSAFGMMREPGYRALVRLVDPKYVPPLNESRLRVILMAAYRHGNQPENIWDVKQVLSDYMRIYEARRVAGLHDGPRMQEIYLYRLMWRLRADGTHATKPRVSEELIAVNWRDMLPSSFRPGAPAVVEIEEEQ